MDQHKVEQLIYHNVYGDPDDFNKFINYRNKEFILGKIGKTEYGWPEWYYSAILLHEKQDKDLALGLLIESVKKDNVAAKYMAACIVQEIPDGREKEELIQNLYLVGFCCIRTFSGTQDVARKCSRLSKECDYCRKTLDALYSSI